MDEIDFILEAVQRDLDLLRMKKKTKGTSYCAEENGKFMVSAKNLYNKINKKIDHEED